MSTQITVYGKTYNVKAQSTEADPQLLAEFVNAKMHELSGTKARPATSDLAILTALNIAQDLFEARSQIQNLQNEQDSVLKEMDQRAQLLAEVLERELKAKKTGKSKK